MTKPYNNEEFEVEKEKQRRRGSIELPVIDRLIATVESKNKEIEVHKAFADLAVKERDHERVLALTAEKEVESLKEETFLAESSYEGQVERNDDLERIIEQLKDEVDRLSTTKANYRNSACELEKENAKLKEEILQQQIEIVKGIEENEKLKEELETERKEGHP